ncbi:3-oxoacyl-[acyl-carrier protein] reductase [Streptomyces sp. yr375]|uniref:SDR family NAD(P)-dependent oxidoreductase n=1 Tax=Streptomyces sp. yr375 TaxID=1761906 RepID=UPI0008B3EAFF|nr:SDR family NAD(P)-dependent oxidoreductase [Streptomyces sp. yr375]SER47868.1 3-oxoacyl-[acyl-carrier protein] reductase [Streptomyces sp. yr375]
MADDARVALVTGASGTIGSAVARELAGAGFRVAAGFHRDGAAARRLAAELPDALAVPLDVTDPDAVRAAFRQIAGLAGPVTVLVNAAGVLRDRPLLRMTDRDWDEVLAANLTGPFRCVRQALPSMIAAGYGRIVSIGSAAAAFGTPGQANYCAAKAGLLALTRSVARESGRHGVTANVVAPGLVESPLVADIGAASRSGFLERAATGALVSAEDVAGAVRFCVETPGLTGQSVDVDGGFG